MKRMHLVLLVGSIAIIGASITVATASTSVATPLFTFRMQQASSSMKFLPTTASGFIYNTASGYTLDYTCSGAICGNRILATQPINTCSPDCTQQGDTCSSTCPDTCYSTCSGSTCSPTCPNTCPNTCPYTCDDPTCPASCYGCQTHSPSCSRTCQSPEPCYPPQSAWPEQC